MNLSIAISFLLFGGALAMLGIVLYKRVQQDEKQKKEH